MNTRFAFLTTLSVLVLPLAFSALINRNVLHAQSVINAPSNYLTLNSGLVGWWTMDGSDTIWTSATAGTVIDKSGNGYTGTLNSLNQATAPDIGKIGQGLKFTGQPNVRINVSSATSTGTTFTVSFWAKPNWSQPDSYGTIIGQSSANALQFASGSTVRKITYYYSGGNHFNNTQLASGRWYHYVLVSDGGSGTIYLNTSADGTMSSIPGFTFSYIGGHSNGEEFMGTLDDVRIYNRALSANEIKALYNSTAGKFSSTPENVTAPAGCTSGLTCGLVGHWTFDGKDINWATQTVVDRSGNGNTGTLTNMSTTTSPAVGKIGQALRFDGVDDQIVTPLNSALDGLNSMTVAFWYKTTSFAPMGRWQNGRQFHFNIYDTNGYRVNWRYGGSGSGGSTLDHTGSNTGHAINDNKWHHVVFIYNNPTSYIYEDGVINSSASGNGGALNTAVGENVRIGTRSISSAYHNGLIDDVRIYNRALSADEVKQLYNMGR